MKLSRLQHEMGLNYDRMGVINRNVVKITLVLRRGPLTFQGF